MDPLLRLTIKLSQLLRGRPGKAKLVAMAAALAAALAVVAVEKLGWWPSGWEAGKPARTPRIQPP